MLHIFKNFFFLILLIIIPDYAYAYLDPGTGSIIFQAILGFIAAVISYFFFFWKKVKSLFKKIFCKKKDE